MLDKIVGAIGAFSYRHRKLIAALACVLFVCTAVLQSFARIEYSYAEESLVSDIFPQDDNLLIVYDNADEDKIDQVLEYLAKDEHVTSAQAYANTLGMKVSCQDIAGMMGIDEMFVNTLFYMYEYGMTAKGMTLKAFTDFISADEFINNPMFSSMIDEDTRGQIGQLKSLVDALASEEEYSAAEISSMLDVDEKLVQGIFYIQQLKNTTLLTAPANFFATVSDILGMDAKTIERLYKIEPVKAMKFTDFVDLVSDIAFYGQIFIDETQRSQLEMFEKLAKMVENETLLFPDDLAKLMESVGESELLTEDNITLLYILAQSNMADMSETRIPLLDLLLFLSEEVFNNPMFAPFLDESMKNQFTEAQTMIDEGLAQLVGEDHSRMVITLDYPLESEGINRFYVDFSQMLDDTLEKDYYLVGLSAMSYEVSQSFREEYTFISIITAVAVFAVVLFTFRKLSISLLLICVIECAVFAMMSVMVIIGEPMFFIAMILVQCILMGSMIDYGILFTTYYKEVRKELPVETALPEVMRRATHAILTSSLVIVLVTLLCGRLMTGAVATILTTLGIGALCAILLILFVLPSLLVIFDKQVMGIKVKKEEEEDPFDD